MKFNLHVAYRDVDGEPWIEDYNRSEITTEEHAHQYGEQIIKYFNDTLRPGEEARKLLNVTFEDNGLKAYHDWSKTNLYTIIDPRLGVYDTLRCVVCRITAKRYGLTTIKIDSKYRAKGYKVCPPEVKTRAKAEER